MNLLRKLRLPTEPVLWEGFVKACLGLVIGWPLITLTHNRIGLVLAVYAALAAIALRAKVTPEVRVQERIDTALDKQRVDIHDFLTGVAETATKPVRAARKRA